MKRLLVTVLAGFLLLTGTATASALPRVINGSGDLLHPEGVAWDPTRQAFLVGSVTRGTISVVRADGKAQTLVSDPQVTATLGVHVDVARNRILAAYSGGLGIFDLRSGKTLHRVKLGKSANDVAIDWFGNAYVTDPQSDTLYKVDTDGQATVLLKDPRLAGVAFGQNGIAWHPLGFLLVVHYENGKLFRIWHGRLDEVRLDKPLVGGDGIALRPDGSLVVVTNNIGSTGEDAVTVLRPKGLWSGATVTRHTTWSISAPTTVATTPYGDYVVNGHLDWLLKEGRTSNEFILSRI